MNNLWPENFVFFENSYLVIWPPATKSDKSIKDDIFSWNTKVVPRGKIFSNDFF